MAIVRKDRVLSGYNGNLESVIVTNDGSTAVETTNGVFVKLGDLVAGEAEVKYGTLAVEADMAEEVLLVHNPEVMADERKYKLADYLIEAGKTARAYRLADGDIITLTADLFDGVPAKGDLLTVKTAGKLGVPTLPADADTAKIAFKVIEDATRELDLNTDSYAVQVVR
jgi:hypothetical protein